MKHLHQVLTILHTKYDPFDTHPPSDLQLVQLGESQVIAYMEELQDDPNGCTRVIRDIFRQYSQSQNGRWPMKIGEVPTQTFDMVQRLPTNSSLRALDDDRYARGVLPARNTLILRSVPQIGPFIIVQEGFAIPSQAVQHVEVAKYNLTMLTVQPKLFGPAVPDMFTIGHRIGVPHQYVLDNFGKWVRLDLSQAEIEAAKLPELRNKSEWNEIDEAHIQTLTNLLRLSLGTAHWKQGNE